MESLNQWHDGGTLSKRKIWFSSTPTFVFIKVFVMILTTGSQAVVGRECPV